MEISKKSMFYCPGKRVQSAEIDSRSRKYTDNFDRYIYTPVVHRARKIGEIGECTKKDRKELVKEFVGQTLASGKMNFAASCAG